MLPTEGGNAAPLIGQRFIREFGEGSPRSPQVSPSRKLPASTYQSLLWLLTEWLSLG
jgi:hypothetical protein